MSMQPETAVSAQLARFRRAFRGFFLAEGAARLALTALGCVAVAVAADYFLELGASARWAILGLALALIAAQAWRCLAAPARLALDDLALAEVLERLAPGLNGRLLAAVELSGPAAESAAESLARLRPAALLRTPVLAVEAAALAAVLVAAAGAWASPRGRAALSAGLVRFVQPSVERAWPSQTQLALEIPSARRRIARGDDLPAQARASGRVPDQVWFGWTTESGARGEVRGRPSHSDPQCFEARIPAVLESLTLRARGGDGRSESLRIEVVDRPRIESYQARLAAPAYTGLGESVQTATPFRIQHGTRVTLQCTANKPLAAEGTSLEFTPKDGPGKAVAVEVSGRTLTARFVAEVSVVGRLALRDAEGFSSRAPQEFEIRCAPDAPPVVELLEPRADRRVTPDARLTVAAVASDDFALGAVELRFQGPGAGAPERALVLAEPAPGTRRQAARALWDLQALKLAPGDRLSFHVAARDRRGEGEKGLEGRSAPLHVEIAARDEVAESVHKWQQRLSGQLEQLRAAQQAAHSRLKPLAFAGPPPADARNILADVGLRQEDVLRQALRAREEFGRLVEEVYANRLNRPDLDLRLGLVGGGFKELAETALPGVRAALASGRADAPGRAGALQLRALAVTENLIGLLREWGDVEYILMRVRRARELQEAINADTKAAAGELMARALDSLSEEQKTRLLELSTRQAARRDEMGLAVADLRRLADEVKTSQVQFAQRILGLLGSAQRAEIVPKMSACAAAIAENRCASILGTQDEVLAALKLLVQRLEESLKPESYQLPENAAAQEVDLDTIMTQLEQAVRPIIAAERKILEEVQAIDAARPKEGAPPRPLAIRLAVAGQAQGAAEAAVAKILEDLKKERTVLFPLVFADILRDMQKARKLLGESRTDPPVQAVIADIIAALEDVASAATKEVIITEIKHVFEERFPGAAKAELVFIEDVRMLRLLQAGLNRKTEGFDRERAEQAFEKLDEDRRAALAALGRRQRELADLADKIGGAARLELEKLAKPGPDGKPPPPNPALEKTMQQVGSVRLPTALMREVAKVIADEHQSGRLVQKNQKVILEKLDEQIRGLISMVQAVSDMPNQPPPTPGLPGAPDILKPPPDLTHLTGGPVGERSAVEKSTDASRAAAWGQLPPRLREAILQARGERCTGRYADLVRLYYQTLSEK